MCFIYLEFNEDQNEESLIRYYFSRGFQYKEIIKILAKNHNYVISSRTLTRRLRQYDLHRTHNNINNVDHIDHNMLETAIIRIDEIIKGPGSSGGYRTVLHALKLEGIYVPRLFVQWYLHEFDPEGCEMRRCRSLKRREYTNRDPMQLGI